MSHALLPIPAHAGDTSGWQSVPIRESHEPLVAIGTVNSFPDILTYPAYRHSVEYKNSIVSLHSLPAIYVRHSMAKRLQAASALLPLGIQLLVVDGYRSPDAQRALYEHYAGELRSQQPTLDHETVQRYTQKFVSEPSADNTKPSPHATGGALDVVLIRNGRMLEFGTAFDHGSPRASLGYFEELANIRCTADEAAQVNRRILYWAMSKAGFQAYQYEWWHFNAPETQMGAACLRAPSARFGYAEPKGSLEHASTPVQLAHLPIERIAPRPEDMLQ